MAVAKATAAVALVLLPPSATTLATSPSPAASPGTPGIEAWLDSSRAFPPDTPAGGVSTIALTVWDPAHKAFVPLEGVFVRVHPAKGKAAPTSVDATTDWPGHLLMDAVAPAGGPGRLEFGVHEAGGDRPLKIAGVGPPPDAPLGDLVQAQLQEMVGDVVAGRQFPLAVSLGPRGWWSFDALHLPDRLVVSAAHPGGPELTSTELVPDGPAGAPYTGHLTIPETGDIELTFLIPGHDGQPDALIAASTTPIQVIQSGLRLDGTTPRPGASGVAAPQAPAQAADGGPPTLVWIGLAGLLVLAVVLVFGGTIRGWLRRDD